MANEFDPKLPSNRLIFEVRRDSSQFTEFADHLEEFMERYGLGAEERAAWRAIDVQRLGELGVHPYFLPQVTRLIRGSANNDSKSQAAQAYRRSFGEQIVDHPK